MEELVEVPWFKPVVKISVRQALTQAAMHSHYHRGQNATRLRELGGVPPMTDFIVWLTQGKPGREVELMTRGGKPFELRSKDSRGGCPYTRLFRDAVLFVLGAEDAVDGVGGAAAGFVVVADLHFAQQADRQQIQAAEQQAQSGHHQRAVRGHHRDVAQEFFHSQPEHDRAAAENAHHAECCRRSAAGAKDSAAGNEWSADRRRRGRCA